MNYKGYWIQTHYSPCGYEWTIIKDETVVESSFALDLGKDAGDAANIASQCIDKLQCAS